MRLFIAEKPSLARAIAEVLPPPHKREKDYIECGEGNVVAWCAGHILETAQAEAYSSDYKQWRLEHLPILPTEWKHEVKKDTSSLLKTIEKLLKRATSVVHAGDPDREGQLLVDEVLGHLGYNGPTERILISDLSPPAVKAALGSLKPNTAFHTLYLSALARQRADWLYGINMTRMYTLLGRVGGYDGVLSVGRVQTPLLGLVVQRDQEIEHFRPKPFFALAAMVRTNSGATFRATWQPGVAVDAFLDEEKRLLSKETAESVRQRTTGQSGVVLTHTDETKSEAPPLPYSLADIQMDAAKRLGMSAAKVLEACQSLYETHKLATYPRSDCAYLPEGHWMQAPAVLAAVAKTAPTLAPALGQVDPKLRSRAWNDSKITAHHAIIPTPTTVTPTALSDAERGVYELIARRYLMQFLANHEYLQTQVELEVGGERFTTRGRQVTAVGWKVLLGAQTAQDDEGEESKAAEDENVALPPLKQGEPVVASEVTLTEKKTQPPKPFTDASLIQAMCSVARYVTDPKVKQILRDTDGIGTPATRANCPFPPKLTTQLHRS